MMVTGAGAASGAAISVVTTVLVSLLTVAGVEAESPTSASDVARGFWQCFGAVLVLAPLDLRRRVTVRRKDSRRLKAVKCDEVPGLPNSRCSPTTS